MKEPTKLSIFAAMALYDILGKLRMDKDGKEKNYPFLLSYKMQRNKDLLEKDIYLFSSKRTEVLKDLGIEVQGSQINVPADKKDQYEKEVSDIGLTQVSHTFSKFTIDEVMENFSDAASLTAPEMELFMYSFVDDPELLGEQGAEEEKPEV